MRTLSASELPQYADHGDMYAQYYLGNKYAQGAEVPQDLTKAKYYWEKAAEQGNANALYNLGMIYYSGQGAAKNPELALNYFQRSAQAGNSRAALNAGTMLEAGQGTIVNIPAAAHYYQLAAPTQPHAAYRLGMLYTQNRADFPADYEKARSLFQQAAVQGDRIAPRALNIVQNYPPAEASELLRRLNTSI
ncbi:hypothetical protein GCM10007161_20460 [Ignatzschineria indica]|nr:hypothetical protein GCM10007161_20460 [Ignatzschineria indica]